MKKRYIEKIFIYLLTFIITIIGFKYIFTSKQDSEVAPVMILSFFLLIMIMYIYYMNKKNQKIEEDGVVLRRENYYIHKYDNNQLEDFFKQYKNNEISKKKFNKLVYGDKEFSTITIPFNEISNVRKEKDKYYMHVESLRYDVEITNYKVLKYLQNLNTLK